MSNWKEMILKDYIDLIPGYAFSSDLFNDAIGMPLIRIRDFESQNPITFYSGEYDGKYIVNPGDKLISMDGEFNIIEWKGPCSLLNQRVCKIESNNNEKIDIQFLMYRLVRELKNIETRTPATTVKHLSLKDIQFLKLAVPPLKEQQKIAEILSSVDAVIEKTEGVIAKTEEVKKGLMQKLLTKGIGHTEFKQTEIGEIPIEWSFLSLKEMLSKNIILDHLDGNHGSLYPKSSEFTEDGVPYVSANMILDSKIDFTKSKFLPLERASKFKKGIAKNDDILFAHNATVGPVALLETNLDYVILSTTLTYYRPNLEVLHNKFLMYYMQSNQFVKQYTKVMGQSTRNQVPITAQREFYFVLPPLKEQLEIVAKIDIIDIKLSTEKAYVDNLINLKQGLMQQLLTGKTRVKID